jgi:hypothetical protein
MRIPIPPIDTRQAADIAKQVQSLIRIYAPEWREFDTVTGQPEGVSAALIAIFARYAELIIERLNRVPEKNQLAFFDILGAAPQPPQPARVPLTFSLAAGTTVDALIPAGTQVAGPPAAGTSEPVIFETERDLIATPVQLTALFTRDPRTDRYADRSSLALPPPGAASSVFEGDHPIEHVLYLGHNDLFGFTEIAELQVIVQLAAPIATPDPRRLVWEIWDGVAGSPLTISSDSTESLTLSGRVVFGPCTKFPELNLRQHRSRWLRCRLLTPVSLSTVQQDGSVRVSQLPVLSAIKLQAKLERHGLRCDALFANGIALDQNQEYLPFGAKPAFGDTFYLGCREAFAIATAEVTLHIVLINSKDAQSTPVPPVFTSNDLSLRWEFWDGQAWVTITAITDGTDRLTKSGDITIRFSSAPRISAINGVENVWVRVRIVAGNYGKEGRIKIQDPPAPAKTPPDPPDPAKKPPDPQVLVEVPATLAPPLISNVRLDYVAVMPETFADTVLTYNDFTFDEPTADGALTPFRATTAVDPTFYFGFTLPSSRTRFPNRPMSLYCHTPSLPFGRIPDDPNAQSPPRLVWESWNGTDWVQLFVLDKSKAFQQPGLVEFLPPATFAAHEEFNLSRYWLRVRWVAGAYAYFPNFDQVLLNTTTATQTRTIRNEVLGSSDGSQQQAFRVTQVPILIGQRLEVREPEGTAQADIGVARATNDSDPRRGEAWIAWQEVTDFHGSGPLDRHYVLDRITGSIRFGDGQAGRIPPIGVSNIRLAWYQTGGGNGGNAAAGTVTQLQSSIPFVDTVRNVFAAEGGADAETLDDFLTRAPCGTRHLGYAVSLEDYEDLAQLATPEVARVKAVTLLDLAKDPDGRTRRPGTVSLIVVPRTDAIRPMPSLELLTRVQTYIDTRRSPLVDLVLVGPEYVRVDVELEVVPVSLEAASDLETRLTDTLNNFLHPLTGGLDGLGWSFGRKPHRSDLFVLVEAVAGVDHVRTLNVIETPERAGAEETGRFLVYAGTYRITLTDALPAQTGVQ